jgi:hypothetical protein
METVLGHNYGPQGGNVQQGASGTVAVNAQAELIIQIDARDASGNLQQLAVLVENGQARLLVSDPDVLHALEQMLLAQQSTNDRLQAFLDSQTRYMEQRGQ